MATWRQYLAEGFFDGKSVVNPKYTEYEIRQRLVKIVRSVKTFEQLAVVMNMEDKINSLNGLDVNSDIWEHILQRANELASEYFLSHKKDKIPQEIMNKGKIHPLLLRKYLYKVSKKASGRRFTQELFRDPKWILDE
jgi:hypothetical protein